MWPGLKANSSPFLDFISEQSEAFFTPLLILSLVQKNGSPTTAKWFAIARAAGSVAAVSMRYRVQA